MYIIEIIFFSRVSLYNKLLRWLSGKSADSKARSRGSNPDIHVPMSFINFSTLVLIKLEHVRIPCLGERVKQSLLVPRHQTKVFIDTTVDPFGKSSNQCSGRSIHPEVKCLRSVLSVFVCSGVIRNTEPLEYEKSHNHILSVVAYDCGMRQSAPVMVTIKVNKPCVPLWKGTRLTTYII